MFDEITPDEVAAWLQQGASLIDVREAWEFEMGHLPGALNLPMSQIAARLDEIPDNVVLVCQSGNRSAHVAGHLALNGYERVANLVGGTVGWIEAGNRVSSDGSSSDD